MAIQPQADPLAGRRPGETVVHTTQSTQRESTAQGPAHPPAANHQPPKPATPQSPPGFIRPPGRPTGATPPPTQRFSTPTPPQSSNLGRFITFGIIGLLIILLIYQVISKGRVRSQVATLEETNASLSSEVASLKQNLEQVRQAPPAATPTPITQTPGSGSTVTPAATPTPAPNPGSVVSPTSPASKGSIMTTTTQNGQVVTETLAIFPFPITYRENQYQKIAQTISVTSPARISAVHLMGVAGKGNGGQLSLYENPDFGRLNDSSPIAKRSFDTSKIPANQFFSVSFDKPVELKAGTRYLMVVETTKKDSQAEIAYRQAAPTAPGTMWVYSRKVSQSGTVLDNNFSWQEIPGYDLFFELRGAE